MLITLDNTVLRILAIIGVGLLLVVLGTAFSLILRGIDRRLSARMQGRYGPPVIQPFRDVRKLLMKESIVPDNAIGWLFNGAPLLAAAGAVVLLAYIPLFGLPPLLTDYSDIILVLYLLIIPSLALVAGGFASGSPYATVGAQREMIIMMSYELPLAVVILAIVQVVNNAGIANPFLLSTLTANPFWEMVGPLGIIGGIIMLLVLAVVGLGESGKVPSISPRRKPRSPAGFWSNIPAVICSFSTSPILSSHSSWLRLSSPCLSPGTCLLSSALPLRYPPVLSMGSSSLLKYSSLCSAV